MRGGSYRRSSLVLGLLALTLLSLLLGSGTLAQAGAIPLPAPRLGGTVVPGALDGRDRGLSTVVGACSGGDARSGPQCAGPASGSRFAPTPLEPPWAGAVVGELTNVSLPNGPGGIAADDGDGTIFVAGGPTAGRGNLTVIRDGAVVAVRSLPGPPGGLAYDPVTGDLVVAELTNSSVLIVNATNLTITSTVAVMDRPQAVAYDPSDREVYVANETGGTVAVLNGSTVVTYVSTRYTGTGYQGGWWGGIASDPRTGLVYVTGLDQHTIGVINGTTFVENLSLPPNLDPQSIGYDPVDGLVYATMHDGPVVEINGTSWSSVTTRNVSAEDLAVDPANGLVYVDNGTGLPTDGISALEGTTWAAPAIPTGAACGAMGYAPAPEEILAACGTSDLVFVATDLDTSPVNVTPIGSPAESLDVGQGVNLTATDSAPGMNWSIATVVATPSSVLRCVLGSASAWNTSVATLSVSCTGVGPGRAEVVLTAGNPGGFTVNSSVALQVFPDPIVGPSELLDTAGTGATSADVGEPVYLLLNWSDGSGAVGSVQWLGLPSGACPVNSTGLLACTFGAPANLTIRVLVTDSNGARTGLSPPLLVPVYPRPAVGVPGPSRASSDVGQAVTFSAAVEPGTGAPGAVAFAWTGLPGRCSPVGAGEEQCLPDRAGTFSVQVATSDANGMRSNQSPILPYVVDSDPSVAIDLSTSSPFPLGAGLSLNVTVLGGAGGGSFLWSGLPAGCPTTGKNVTCQLVDSGNYSIAVAYTDSNGFRAQSSNVSVTVSQRPPTGTSPAPPDLLLLEVGGLVVVGGAVVVTLVLWDRHRRGSRGIPRIADPTVPGEDPPVEETDPESTSGSGEDSVVG